MDYYQLHELPETYTRYKAATANFEKWLLRTSKNRGLEIAKQAEANAKQAASNQKKTDKSKPFRILSKDILSLAEAVAASGITKQDEKELDDLKLAIRLRKEVIQWYGLRNLYDAGHEKFLKVLQNVHTVLKNCAIGSPEASGNKEPQRPEKVVVILAPFKELGQSDDFKDEEEVFKEGELKPDSLNTKGSLTKRTSSHDKHGTAPKASKDELEMEQDFQVLCFLFDLYQLRHCIKNCWNDWVLQKIGTMTAAIVSDLAMSVIHRQATVLIDNLKDHGNDRTVSDVIYKLHQLAPEGQKEQPSSSSQGEPNVVPIGVFCLDAISVVEKFWAIESKEDLSVGEHIPRNSFCLRFLLHSKLLGQSKKLRLATGLPLDRFTESLSFPDVGGEAWLPFGFQVLLDIQELLANNLSYFRYDVLDHGNNLFQCLQEHFSYEDKVWDTKEKPDYMTVDEVKWSTQYLPTMEKMTNWTKELLDRSTDPRTDMSNPYVLTVNPILSGKAMWDYHRTFHGDAIHKVQWFIVALAHLYNACLQVGGLDISWPDLDFIIESQGEARVFVGGRPKDPDLFHKRLALALGVSPSKFSKNYRGSGESSHHGPQSARGLVSLPPLPYKIATYFKTESRSERSTQLHNLFAFLLQGRGNTLDKGVESSSEVESPNDSEASNKSQTIFNAIAAKRSPGTKNKKSQKKNRSKMPDFSKQKSVHADLLNDVVSQLAEHETYASFDHLDFFRRASEFMTYIRPGLSFDNSEDPTKLDANLETPNDFTRLYNLFYALRPPRDKSQKRQAHFYNEGMQKMKTIGIVLKSFILYQGSDVKTAAEEQMRRRRQHEALFTPAPAPATSSDDPSSNAERTEGNVAESAQTNGSSRDEMLLLKYLSHDKLGLFTGIYHRLKYSPTRSKRVKGGRRVTFKRTTLGSGQPVLRLVCAKKKSIFHMCRGKCFISKKNLGDAYDLYWSAHGNVGGAEDAEWVDE